MIREIQYLRGIAASMVVLYHVIPQIRRMGYSGPAFESLSYGVDIFFVISGFIMTFISIDAQPHRIDFIKNRLVRIVPTYWLLTTFILAVGIAAPSLLQSTRIDLPQYLKSLFFIPYIHPVQVGYFPLLQPGWTLNYEMYFYLVFALFLGIRGDHKYPLMILTLSFLTTAISQLLGHSSLEFYGNPIILEFCFGILLGYAYVRYPQFSQVQHASHIGSALLFSGFALLFSCPSLFPEAGHVIVVGLPSLLIVTGALLLSNGRLRIRSTTLQAIGDSSYSLYLSHYILMSALGQFFRKAILPYVEGATYILFPIVAFVICLIAGHIFYSTVEVNLTRKIRRVFSGSPARYNNKVA